eukprot:1140244-Pelagomonas_calceolata.AAC.6
MQKCDHAQYVHVLYVQRNKCAVGAICRGSKGCMRLTGASANSGKAGKMGKIPSGTGWMLVWMKGHKRLIGESHGC